MNTDKMKKPEEWLQQWQDTEIDFLDLVPLIQQDAIAASQASERERIIDYIRSVTFYSSDYLIGQKLIYGIRDLKKGGDDMQTHWQDPLSQPRPETASAQVGAQNFISPDHPHGPPDPNWMTVDGRCLLCALTYNMKLKTENAFSKGKAEGRVEARKEDITLASQYLNQNHSSAFENYLIHLEALLPKEGE